MPTLFIIRHLLPFEPQKQIFKIPLAPQLSALEIQQFIENQILHLNQFYNDYALDREVFYFAVLEQDKKLLVLHDIADYNEAHIHQFITDPQTQVIRGDIAKRWLWLELRIAQQIFHLFFPKPALLRFI